MNIRVLDLVVCPTCKKDLKITVFSDERTDNIVDGALMCRQCGRKYPVIDGIPRILPDEMIGSLLYYHKNYFERYSSSFPTLQKRSGLDSDVILKQKTLRSFSFQWNTFGKVYMEYGLHWSDYLPDTLKQSYFKGKTGLDVGCGFGRHIIQAAKSGAEMVGIDLSEAVVAAYKNTKDLPNVHIIQGDIYSLPFREGTFDFIYSLGVLHHLPNPQEGFKTVVKLLGPEQDVFIWCYDNEKPQKNAMYEFIRRFTTKLSYRNLYYATFLAAVGVKIFLNYPELLLIKLGLKDKKFPYDYYIKYPFRVLHADLFDVFAVPSTMYYDRNELEEWFVNSHLKINEVRHAVSGWTVYGGKE